IRSTFFRWGLARNEPCAARILPPFLSSRFDAWGCFLQHAVAIRNHLDALFFGLLECFGMQIVTAFLAGFLLFDRDSILVRPGILANAGHLPTDFNTRRAGLNRKVI